MGLRTALGALLVLAACSGRDGNGNCRDLATHSTSSLGDVTSCTVDAPSDGGSAKVDCAISPQFPQSDSTETSYPSVAALVAERALGVRRFSQSIHRVTVNSTTLANLLGFTSSLTTTTANYDGGTPLRLDATTVVNLTDGGTETHSSATVWSAWDPQGRPTRGTVNGATVTVSYDEPALTVAQTVLGADGGGLPTIDTFDLDGNEIAEQSSGRVTQTIDARQRVCAP